MSQSIELDVRAYPVPSPRPRPYLALGQQVRADRLAARLSQEEVAQAIDLSQTYLSHIENGRHRPDPDVLRALARKLDTDYEAYAALAGYMEKPAAGLPLVVPEESADDVRDIATYPPAIIKVLRGIGRELKILYLASGRTDGNPDENVSGR